MDALRLQCIYRANSLASSVTYNCRAESDTDGAGVRHRFSDQPTASGRRTKGKMDFGRTEEELEFRIRDMEEELKRVKNTELESKILKDQEEKNVLIISAVGKKEKVEQMIIKKKDQVSLGSKESDMDQYMDLDEKRLIKERQKNKEKKCWSKERLEAMPGVGIGFCLVTVLLYQCMNIITKKMTTHPFVILFLRDCLLTPQVIKTKQREGGESALSLCYFPLAYFPFAVLPSAYLWQDNTFSKRQDVAFSPEVRVDRQ